MYKNLVFGLLGLCFLLLFPMLVVGSINTLLVDLGITDLLSHSFKTYGAIYVLVAVLILKLEVKL
ncbi:hypothetical protein VP277E431_P0104 [Vibrio phage 277E43-1]|nr:hypothetical protein VP277E431_P0104 [Vibrio phage 277E43-1]